MVANFKDLSQFTALSQQWTRNPLQSLVRILILQLSLSFIFVLPNTFFLCWIRHTLVVTKSCWTLPNLIVYVIAFSIVPKHQEFSFITFQVLVVQYCFDLDLLHFILIQTNLFRLRKNLFFGTCFKNYPLNYYDIYLNL